MNNEWADCNKRMQSLLKKNSFSDGIEELISLRNMLLTEMLSWKDELSLEDYSKMPFPNVKGYHCKTIGYSIWHIIRIEDIVVNSLIQNRKEIIFSDDFLNRINSDIITTGNELSSDEIVEFSKRLDINELYEYAISVKEATDKWLREINYEDLKTSFTDDDKNRIRCLGVVSNDEEAEWLVDYWCDKDIKGLIKMPLSRHWIMHIEAAIRIIDKINLQEKL